MWHSGNGFEYFHGFPVGETDQWTPYPTGFARMTETRPSGSPGMTEFSYDIPISAGRHAVVFDSQYDGPGIAKGGTGVLKVDGKEVAELKIPHTVPVLEALDEWMDVGYDTCTGIDDRDYQVPFHFTGKINKIAFRPGPLEMTAERMETAANMSVNGKD